MNWDQIAGDWTRYKGKIREQWAKLSDSEVERIAGQRDQLIGQLEKSYGVAREEAEKQVADFEEQLNRLAKQTRH
jgi:uncharacterized protein YjbJ (UPF0337 family)